MKIKYICVALLLVAVIFSGCSEQIKKSSKPEVKGQSGNEVLNECFSKIDETPGESYVQYQKDLCRLSVAKESKNQGLCSGIDNENKKEECNKYFDELPFVEGTATREDILDKCKCDRECYGVKYELNCIYENVRTPQQCQSFVGLHYANEIIYSSDKIYFEEENLKSCLRSLIDRQDDLAFCEEYSEIYSEVCADIKQENIKAEKKRIASSTMHIMTDDKDEWIKEDIDKGKAIIEEWKKDGYTNFAIIDCKWHDELEICIDFNTIYREGKELECNFHKYAELYGMENISGFVGSIPSKWC